MVAGIQNGEALVAIFGCWPSFHDAELLAVRLESDKSHYGALEADVHVFEMTREVDERGCFVLKNHSLVRFRFRGLADVELDDFKSSNVLSSLEIDDIEVIDNQRCPYSVVFDAILGCELSFKCQEIAVLSVEAFGVGNEYHA